MASASSPKVVASDAEKRLILNALATQRDVYLRASRAEKDADVAAIRQKAADSVSVLMGKISTGELEF